MYRYSPNRMRGATGAPKLRERVKTIVLAALIVALVALAVVGVPAMRFRSEAKELFIARIQLECGNALSLTNSLGDAGAHPQLRVCHGDHQFPERGAQRQRRVDHPGGLVYQPVRHD